MAEPRITEAALEDMEVVRTRKRPAREREKSALAYLATLFHVN